jgi:hypothetical protein
MCIVNLIAATFLIATPLGCSRDVRLAGKNVRKHVSVKPVTFYGQTLDETASPKQVAFAVLMAIRDDFLAANEMEREAALDKQFDLCAPTIIAQKYRFGQTRDESVYQVVHRWTPTVSHYVGDFPTDWETAKKRLVAVSNKNAGGDEGSDTQLVMEVNDPSGDPNARVVLAVYLTQEQKLWRATHLGFATSVRAIRN